MLVRNSKIIVLLVCGASSSLQWASAFSTATPPSSTMSSSSSSTSSNSEDVYFNQYSAGQQLDQAAYESDLFWKEIDKHIPLWNVAPEYERFRGFCDNLKTKEPGKEIFLPNGQQLLEQYVYPGLNHGDITPMDKKGVKRSAYPAEHYSDLKRLQDRLAKKVAPVAKQELESLLSAKPLAGDDAEAHDGIAVSNEGETWQRAAWYGWQFLSMRGAKSHMPKTSKALTQAMGKLGPAHRFVGLTRQKANCVGVKHSDGRNYMLSTLTPVVAPKGCCGIFVDDIDAKIETDPVILDNTFSHHVYNHHPDQDRFVVMSECWHPSLTFKERDALATLFAVKDQFTVKELQLAPWGYDDDDLEIALKIGAVDDLNYWKEIGYSFDQSKKGGKKNKASGGGGFGK